MPLMPVFTLSTTIIFQETTYTTTSIFKKRRIGALITNLKDVIFKKFRVLRKDTGKINKKIPPLMQAPFITNSNPAQPRSSHAPSPQAPVHQNTPVFPPQMSYAAITKMPSPQSTHLSQLKHSPINIETVIELLKLYESSRHP